MISLAEAIIWQNYLNPNSDGLMSEVDSFPDIRYLTGNYYVGDTSCGYVYRDKNIRPITSKTDACNTSTAMVKSGQRNGSLDTLPESVMVGYAA